MNSSQRLLAGLLLAGTAMTASAWGPYPYPAYPYAPQSYAAPQQLPLDPAARAAYLEEQRKRMAEQRPQRMAEQQRPQRPAEQQRPQRMAEQQRPQRPAEQQRPQRPALLAPLPHRATGPRGPMQGEPSMSDEQRQQRREAQRAQIEERRNAWIEQAEERRNAPGYAYPHRSSGYMGHPVRPW